MLEEEVEELAGRRHVPKGDESGYRHANPGSVRLGCGIRCEYLGWGPGRRGEARIVRATPRLGRRGGRGALSEGAARDLMPRLRGGGRGGARSDRAVEVVRKKAPARLKEFQERDLSVYDVVAREELRRWWWRSA